MSRELGVRLGVGAVGVLMGAWGAWLLLARGLDNLVATVTWLVAGIAAHDGLLAPVVIVVCFLGVRLLPVAVRRPATVGLIVLGTVSIAAIPVLGRFGERPDNPSLLDRDYTGGWLVLAALTLLGVVLGTAYLIRTRR